MAQPSLARTHNFRVNVSCAGNASALTQNQTLMLEIVNCLLGAGAWTDSENAALGATPAGAWTVVGSSDGATSNMTGTNLWSAANKLIWNNAGSAHSWIVLKQTGISTNFHMLIDLNSTSEDTITIKISKTGFGTALGGGNGSTTAAPTASVSQTKISAASWGGTTTTGIATKLHVSLSTDGKSTTVEMYRTSHTVAHWFVDYPGNALSGWTTPGAFFFIGANTSAPAVDVVDFATVGVSTYTQVTGFANAGTSVTIALATLGYADATTTTPQLFTTTGSISGGYAFCSIHLQGRTAGTLEPNLGIFSDRWFHQTALVSGFGFPGDEVAAGSRRQFVCSGPFIRPWNKSTMVIA